MNDKDKTKEQLINELKEMRQRIAELGASESERKQAEKKTKQAAEEWRTTFDSITDLVSVHDKDFRFIRANMAVANLVGMKPKDLIGKHCYEIFHGRKKPLPNCPHWKSMETKKPVTMELFEARLDKYFEASVSPIFDEQGEFTSSVHIIRDVTERKQSEEALRQSEEELIAIYNSAPIIMMLVDEERRVRKINLKGAKFAQRDTEETIGLRGGEALRCMHHLDDPEGCGFGPFCQTCKVRLTVLDTFKTGKNHHQVEATLPFASREKPVTFLLSTVPLDTPAGRRVLVSIEDITELKKIEGDFENIFNLSPDIEGIFTTEGELVKVNRSWETILGYKTEELLEMGWATLVHPDDVERTNKTVEEQLKGNPVVHFINRYKCKNGSYKTLEWRATFAKEGIVHATARDITERKLAEEALKESEQRFRSIFNNARDGIILADIESKRFYTGNEMICQMLGYNLEEIEGLRVTDIHPQEARPYVLEQFEKQSRGEITLAKDIPVKRKDGSVFYADVNSSQIALAGRTFLMGIFRDITERRRAEETLRGSEEKYRSLFDNMINGFAYCQILVNEDNQPIDFVHLEVNDAWERQVGLRREDVIGKKVTEAIPGIKESKTDLISIYSKVALTGEGTSFDLYFEPLEKWFTISVYSPQRGYFGIVFKNITERKQAEEEIAKLAKFPSENPNPVIRVAQNGTILYANQGALPLLNKWRCRIGKLAPDYWRKFILEVLNSGLKKDAEVEIGNRKLSLTFAPVVDAGYVNIYGLDITERKLAEEALRESEEKLRLMFESVTEGITITDLNGNAVDTNDATARIHGCDSKQRLIGRSAFELIAEKDHARAMENMKRVLEEGFSGTLEYTLLREDGSEFPGELVVTLLRDQSGNPTGFVAVTRDITERKQMEEERQSAAKLESIGILAGGIAHDFNNLLTGIMGNIGLAKRHVEPKSKAMDRLAEAEKASVRAKDLTQQLLTFASGGAPIKETVSVAALISDSATFALRGSNVRVEFSLPDDLWLAEIDEGQISQVITNLVINANEAMPEGGVLNIGAKNTVIQRRGELPLPKGNYVEITIEDHGTGISKEHLDRIFDPYFSTKQKGSGLGLATAYSIIKNHGGYITAKSKLGVGTTFRIYLPASEKPIPKKEETAPVEALITRKGRVMVMDDEEVIRKLLHDELTDVGYEVELTVNGAQAIERYRKAKESGQPFDAVILDLTVPGGVGGKEVIRKLLEIDPNVKAIVSSGYSTDPIMSDFKEYGFSGVVAKPYTIAKLEETLHSIITGKG